MIVLALVGRLILRIRKRRRMSLFARWFISAFGLAPVVAACLAMPAGSFEETSLLMDQRYIRLSNLVD